MSVPPPEYEAFKLRLRSVMAEKNLSVRALGRRLDPQNPEVGRRTIHRWLSPSSTSMPSRASRVSLARALGVADDFFAPAIGAATMGEIARFREEARWREEIARRSAWCGEGVPTGGWYRERSMA